MQGTQKKSTTLFLKSLAVTKVVVGMSGVLIRA